MNNVLLTITGPSGTGKSTLESRLRELHGYVPLLSHTTRPPRPGEMNGVHYHFVSDQAFERLASSDGLVEKIEFNGFKYGMSKAEIDRLKVTSAPGVFVCDPHGKEQIEQYCKTVGITVARLFVDVDPEVQFGRLLDRFIMDDAGANGMRGRDFGEALNRRRKARQAFISRLCMATSVERAWVAQAALNFSDGLKNGCVYRDYDFGIKNFGAETEAQDIKAIVNWVDGLLAQAAPAALSA